MVNGVWKKMILDVSALNYNTKATKIGKMDQAV